MTEKWDDVRLEPWGDGNLELLRRNNVPALMTYLGGPETDEKVIARDAKYVRLCAEGEARMFAIVTDAVPEGVGLVGYWQSEWRDERVYEMAWSTEPEYQGRGISTRALRLCITDAEAQADRRRLVAFPRVDNAASNALARAAGFTLTGETDFEYPPGNPIISNVWVIEA